MSAEGTKMPEPFAKWWTEKGQFISAKDEGDFSLERDIAEASWQEATRLAMERAAKAVRSRESTMSMFATSRECIAHNDAVNECEDAIRRALADVDAKEGGSDRRTRGPLGHQGGK